jgi:hypothetical protein
MSEAYLSSAISDIARCEIPYVRAMIDSAFASPDPAQWLERDILELITYCLKAGIELGEGVGNGSILATDVGHTYGSDLIDGIEAGARIAIEELAVHQTSPSATLDAYRFGVVEGYDRARDELTNGGLR